MSKKSKRAKQSGLTRQGSPLKQHQQRAVMPSRMYDALVNRVEYASEQVRTGDFAGCIRTCEALLNSLPRRSEMRLEILALLGLAHGMLKHYQQSYEAFSEAIVLDPTVAEYWYNRGLACSYMSRPGEAVQNLEHAVELAKNDTSEMARRFTLRLQESRLELQEAMQAHEDGITFEQYMQREERFTRALNLVRQEKWQEAERLFRDLTATGSRIPSYWGNLGVSLMMQSRYDEAEEVLKQALTIDPDYSIARDNLRWLPDVRRSKEPVGLRLLNLSREEDVKQSLALYEKDEKGEIASRTVIERAGHVVTSTRGHVGKQPPRYDFFLNAYQDIRFTTCPLCKIKTLARKFALVIHVSPNYTVVVEKMCRFCSACDLLIVHQDQLEQQLATQFRTINPGAIGNDYQVAGTVDKAEWEQGKQDSLSVERLREYQHDFKEVITFRRVPVE
jgi:tetratricopeptide (TPR) repeat protein